MGDRCYLEITLRRADLDRFGQHLDAAPGEEWWDHLDEEDNQPNIVTASVYEANYAWLDQRLAAAKEGIDFHGWHAEGGEYGPYEFVSFKGKHLEAERNHDGELVIALDKNLKPTQGMANLREYVRTLKKVRAAFAKELPVVRLEAAA
ncbi:MAG: hypothetical protein GX616_26770 [Planctomycetes bacterium]|nr:hypothetical protein [Planctomycetota bacterium]